MKRLWCPSLALILMLGVVGCDVNPGSSEVSEADAAEAALVSPSAQALAARGARATEVRNLDEMFVALNGRMRGLGGFHFTGDGAGLVVTMKPRPGNGNNRPDKVQRQLLREMGRLTGASHLMGPVEAAHVTLAEGAYDFVEIQAWRQQILAGGLPPFVTLLDNDETRNRLVLGVDPGTATADAVSLLNRAGVPHEAVLIEEIEEPILAASPSSILSSYSSNSTTASTGRVGGIKIETSITSGFVNTCTIGFNVVNGSTGERGFLTASHCTQSSGIGGVNNRRFWQPTYQSSGLGYIATERVDPAPYLTNRTDSNCPSGATCRVSDAAFIRYENQSSSYATLGAIARTTAISTTSSVNFTVNQSNPEFIVTSETAFPAAGQLVNKVGARSGWTTATVGSRSCATGRSQGTYLTCTYVANTTFGNAATDEGDSGAPVFITGGTLPNGRTAVSAAGLVYAVDAARQGFYFNPIYAVQYDLGDYQTCSTCN